MIVPVSLLIGSVSLDLLACYCVKRSKGFQKVIWGSASFAGHHQRLCFIKFCCARHPARHCLFSVGRHGCTKGTVLS